MISLYEILKITVGSILCVSLCMGCSADTASDTDTPIALLSTRSLGDSDELYRPVFIFWKTSDVISISMSPYPSPYYVAGSVPNDVKDYETVLYNTQQLYPSDFSTLLATGYIPQDLVPATDGVSRFYHRLTLPASGRGAGRTDLMAPEQALTGSLTNRFDVLGQPLVFKHLQSFVSFRAICAETFPTTMYVDKVCVTVEAASLAGGISWNTTTRTYVAEAATGADVITGHGYKSVDGSTFPTEVLSWYDPAQLSGEEDGNSYSKAGDLYILPNRTRLVLKKVSCRMYPVGAAEDDKDAYTKTAENVTVDFVDGDTSIALGEGESHQVTLYFAQDGIELAGRKSPWKKGGNIVIPVVPAK